MNFIQAIKESCGFEDTAFQFISMDDSIISMIIPQNDADPFESPAAILFNQKIESDKEYQESIWELLDLDLKADLSKMECSLFDVVACLTVIMIHHGHTDPMRVHSVTQEAISGYVGQRLAYMIQPMVERIKEYAEEDAETIGINIEYTEKGRTIQIETH